MESPSSGTRLVVKRCGASSSSSPMFEGVIGRSLCAIDSQLIDEILFLDQILLLL
jgi:hypothetical protein